MRADVERAVCELAEVITAHADRIAELRSATKGAA
jgi:hypothetical protein